MEHIDILNSLFADRTFLSAHKDCDCYEAIYEAVHAVAPEVSMEELKSYLETISKALPDSSELSASDLDSVAGGGAITFFSVVSAVSGCYAIGEGIGKFIYNITHK